MPVIAAVAASLIALQLSGANAAEVFDTVGPAVFQILVENNDGDVLSTGSGFFVGLYGEALSAYHVVDDVVLDAKNYRLIALLGGKRTAIEIVAVDPELDIALLHIAGGEPPQVLPRVTIGVPIGTGVFSLGRPADTGITIVQGTFRGESSDGSLSIGAALAPGMSGGPTVDDESFVVGINVAKGPDVVGQVAPIDGAMRLAKSVAGTPGRNALERLEATLIARQRSVLDLVTSSTKTMMLLDFEVQAPSPCRSNPRASDPRWSFKAVSCTWAREMLLSREYSIGQASVQYAALANRTLFGPHFWSKAREQVGFKLKPQSKDRVREARCEMRTVDLGSLPAKLVFCTREHILFPGLHDFYVSGVTIGAANEALAVDITLRGYTAESAKLIIGALLRGTRRAVPVAGGGKQ